MLMRRMAVRTTRATRFGAGAERIIDDGLDGARAAAALRTATEAAIESLGIAPRDAKAKAEISSNSKLIAASLWNESKS